MFSLASEFIGRAFPPFFWGTLIISALGCCMGFHEFVWFMSVGYGFSVMCIGAFLLVMGLINGVLTPALTVMCILFMIYGYRLGGYLLKRELKNANYKKTLSSTGSDKKLPIPVSAFMWVYASFEYLFQTSSVTYRMVNHASDNLFAWIGVIIMACAILGEATADKQKSAAKAINPKRFCDTGLFKIVRCPNYFSEIMFWVGTTVSGIGTISGNQWIIPIAALILIVYIMYNSAQRLELRHEKNYGLDPEYQHYSDTVPLLFPFTTQYHSMKVYRD